MNNIDAPAQLTDDQIDAFISCLPKEHAMFRGFARSVESAVRAPLLAALSQALAERDAALAQVAQMRAELKSVRVEAAKWEEWIEAQRSIEEYLPEGYTVTLQCSPGDWSLSFTDPDGEEIRIDDYESTSHFIREAVEVARSRAALAGGAQTEDRHV